jgi:hypothetical protein
VTSPPSLRSVGLEATKRFFEFFAVPIRNKNPDAAGETPHLGVCLAC